MSEVYLRSQNKKGLFCLNNTMGIVCSRKEERFIKFGDNNEPEKAKKEKYCLFLQGNGTQNELGEYQSIERCIEVLDEIEQKCGQYLYAAGSLGLIRGSEAIPPMAASIPRLYQMPEK